MKGAIYTELGAWGIFFLKLFVLFAGVYVIIILTPKIAALIDKHKKAAEQEPEAPRPERVEDDDKNEENNDDKEFKS